MVLLGWSLDGSTEVVSLQQVIDNFTLDRITKSAAIFDQEKLLWMNGVYIRDLSAEGLASRMQDFIPRTLDTEEQHYLGGIAPLVQERLKRLDESDDITGYFFGDLAPDYDPAILVQKGMDAPETLVALQAASVALNAGTAGRDFGHESLESLLGEVGSSLSLSRRQFFGLLRTAATGRTVSPPLFETMEVMGRDRVLARLQQASQKLQSTV